MIRIPAITKVFRIIVILKKEKRSVFSHTAAMFHNIDNIDTLFPGTVKA